MGKEGGENKEGPSGVRAARPHRRKAKGALEPLKKSSAFSARVPPIQRLPKDSGSIYVRS